MRITKSLLKEIYDCPNCSGIRGHLDVCVLRDFKPMPWRKDRPARKIKNTKLEVKN